MKTTNDTKHTQGEPLPDTGDILTDALNDAGYWKAEAFRFKQLNAEMLSALEACAAFADFTYPEQRAAWTQAREVIRKAKGQS